MKEWTGPGERDVIMDVAIALLQGVREGVLKPADVITFVLRWEDNNNQDIADTVGKTPEWVACSRRRLRGHLCSSLEGYIEEYLDDIT